ncbi:MAG: 50S ribosomal protein L23 [archaeon]
MVKLNEAEKKRAEVEKQVEKETPAKDKVAPKAAAAAKPASTTMTLEDLGVILHPLITEKAVNMIEAENKVTFIVADTATKTTVKNIVQKAYGVKVTKVNIVRDRKGRKKAIVKLDKANKAQDLATKIGVL